MEPKTIGIVINGIVVTMYAFGAAWRGYHRRRDHWTRGSWIGLALAGVVGIAFLAAAFRITLAVDNHEAWVGVARSSTRSTYALLALSAMTGGLLLIGGSLSWFALGEPSRQFPFLGSFRSDPPSPSLLLRGDDAAVDDSVPSA